MKPPIIVIDESNYVDFYTSVEDAIIGMEPIDVINGLFKAYDSEGYPLKIDVCAVPYSKRRWWQFYLPSMEERVILRDFEEKKTNEKELISILKDFCKKISVNVDKCSSLNDIINVVKDNGIMLDNK